MRIKITRLTAFLIVFGIVLIAGCFTIMNVDQPSTANVGEQISVTVEVRLEDHDDNPHHGILGLLIPKDWTVDLAWYDGDFGPDTMSFLHPDSVDADPGGQVDFWTDSLNVKYPVSDTSVYNWVVYQANTPYANPTGNPDTNFVDIHLTMTVGDTGSYNIGYFVTNAALDFSDSTWFDASLDNEISVMMSTDIGDDGQAVPDQYHLRQNYPNPFNPQTTIRYTLNERAQVSLIVYDMAGRKVATLVNGVEDAGDHGVTFSAARLASGVYFYTLQTSRFTESRKMILMR